MFNIDSPAFLSLSLFLYYSYHSRDTKVLSDYPLIGFPEPADEMGLFGLAEIKLLIDPQLQLLLFRSRSVLTVANETLSGDSNFRLKNVHFSIIS